MTIQLVAEVARVAPSTVSRVLNGGYVSAPARARVTRAVQELNYRPSFAARSLKAGRCGRIGVVCTTSQTPWFLQILAGVEDRLAATHQSVLLASLVLNGVYDPSAVAEWIRSRRIDGLIFVRYTPEEQPLRSAAEAARLPVVLVAPDVPVPAQSVIRCDNVQAGRLIAQHLLQLGHRDIAFLRGPRESMDARERVLGVRETLARSGVRLWDEEIPTDPGAPKSNLEFHYDSVALDMLGRSLDRRPTAVVLANDDNALSLMRAVLQRGLRIPEDLSVAGFDDIPLSGTYWPGLTTVAQPSQAMGRAACQALLDSMEGKSADEVADVQYGVELMVRESTAPPPGAPRSELDRRDRSSEASYSCDRGLLFRASS